MKRKHTNIVIGYVNSFLLRERNLCFRVGFDICCLRLNNRDILRERSSDNDSSNAFHLWSIRQSKNPYKSKTGPTAVAVTVHQIATASQRTSMITTMSQNWTDRYESCTLLWPSGIETCMFLKEGIAISQALQNESA